MTIYLLDNDPKLCASYLDDKSLDRMIQDIAQVLCNVHYVGRFGNVMPRKLEHVPLAPNFPLLDKNPINLWSHWARESKANYLYLVGLGWECLRELDIRNIEHPMKLVRAMSWARDNVPDLPTHVDMQDEELTYKSSLFYLPRIFPKKYTLREKEATTNSDYNGLMDEKFRIIGSYRNYYQAKLKQQIKECFNIECARGCFHKTKHNFSWTNRTKPEWVKL